MWDEGWNKVFTDNEWGKYPPEELVRFVARNYYNVNDRAKIKFLELGSGTGANIVYLAKEGFDATGIDGSKVGVDRTKKRLATENLSARLFIGDVVSLPFDDQSFDCVIDNECIYANSFAESKKIISETCRVLRKGGKFYSKTFMTGTYGDGNGEKFGNEKNTYSRIREGALRKDYGLIRFTDKDEIQELYGVFDIESVDYLIRSDKNMAYEVKEWIIFCKKK